MISVFTPTNNTSWIKEAWDSLSDQYVNFEWLIGINGNADQSNIPSDPRIKIIELGEWKGVGNAKKQLCELANGDILLELDHDDIITERCAEYLHIASKTYPDAGFFFTDSLMLF